MSHQEKIYSSKLSISINIITVVIIPLICWNFFNVTFPDLSQENARKYSQIGAFINMFAGLFLIIRFLWKGRYSRRKLQVEKLDEKLEKHFEYLAHETYSEEQKKQHEKNMQARKEFHAKEMRNILDLDKVERDHMYLGIICLIIGTFMQIVGAGYVAQ